MLSKGGELDGYYEDGVEEKIAFCTVTLTELHESECQSLLWLLYVFHIRPLPLQRGCREQAALPSW